MLFGSIRKQVADPTFNLPARRRVIWEHAEDLAVFLRVSIIYNVLFLLALSFVIVVLLVIINRPPFVINQDQGYVYYRDTESDKLRSSLVYTFLKVTTESLYNYSPGDYRIRGIEHLAIPRVIEIFTKAAKEQADERQKTNRRRMWVIRDMRRWKDEKFPQFIPIILLGEMVLQDERVGSDGIRVITSSSKSTYVMTYLKMVTPTPDNPWGLLMVGVSDLKEQQQPQLIWEGSSPISNTDDLAQIQTSAKQQSSGQESSKSPEKKSNP
ncbi:MAG: hypothetical protein ACOY3I_08600 [Verrucomicrobiota bacterium]